MSLKETDPVIATAYLRRGVAAYALGDFIKAKESFDTAHDAQLEDVSLPIWIRKTNEELEMQKELEKQNADSEKAAAATATPTHTTKRQDASMKTPNRLRHDWYQNDSAVHLSVYIRNAPKDGSVRCEFTERTVSLTCPSTTTPGTDISFDLDPLLYEIDPATSSFQVLTSKIDIKMAKKVAGIAWSKLEGVETTPAATVSSVADAGGKYPTSSRRGPKNWDALAQDTEEDKAKAEGDDAINSLFQKIYRDADEDTRRAMIKSFQESNGTSLSTNWSEVGKGKVETHPPEGMVAKKYGQ